MLLQTIKDNMNLQWCGTSIGKQKIGNWVISNFSHFKGLEHALPPPEKLLFLDYLMSEQHFFFITLDCQLTFKSMQSYFPSQTVTSLGGEQYSSLFYISQVASQKLRCSKLFSDYSDLLKYSILDLHCSITYVFSFGIFSEENGYLISLSRIKRQKISNYKKAFTNKKTCL